VLGKFAETAVANLSLQRSMSPAAAVAADDVAPFFAIAHDPSCGNECPACAVILSVSRIGESHAAGRLLD
jgi:hypothetical protein